MSGGSSKSKIYIIDFISRRPGSPEPEIESRLIHHAADLEEAQENARSFIKGVNFINAQAVKILNCDGIELCS